MELNTTERNSESFDFKEYLRKYTRHWKWILLSVLICLGIAFLVMRYDIPEYLAQASIRIKDSDSSSQLNVFQDLDVFANQDQSIVEDEILILKSRSYLKEVVRRLSLNRRIFVKGQIIDSEIYRDSPFNFNFIAPDSIIEAMSYEFHLRISSKETFGFSLDDSENFTSFQFGKTIETPAGELIITPNMEDIGDLYGNQYRIVISPVTRVAQNYKDRISILPEEKGSMVLGIYLRDPVLQRAKDVINTLIQVYNESTISDKKAIADKTSSFINDRINSLYAELSTVDQTAEEFKSDRRLPDIESQSSLNLSEGALYEGELQKTEIQLDIASSMRDLVNNTEGYELLPSNIGLEDLSIAETTLKYNELASTRKRLLESSSENNPVIRNLDQQLESLKANMSSSLSSMTNNLNLERNSLSKRLSNINSRLYSAPKNERTLRDITRKQETKEALYLYLLQKREESQIAFASAEAKIKTIDPAYSLTNGPVGMDKRIIYLGSILIGLLIPFSIIYVNDLLDTKIHNKLDLEKLAQDLPVLGELPKVGKRQKKIIQEEDRSILAESMRILRTNLDYLLKLKEGTDKKNNIIFVTSSVSGEGKTFLAANLGVVLANSGKKVAIVGADIRNPKLSTFVKENSSSSNQKQSESFDDRLGLTEFLFNKSLDPDDLITRIEVNKTKLDLVRSGKIPPNPAELLLSPRLESFFNSLSEDYDYVIVDTAPLLVVSDTLVISKYANYILYVVRAGKTEKKVIDFPIKLANEGKLKNFSFVINGVENSNLGYGGKYGYGYSSKKKSRWYQRA
ncbi:GumC family protein [Muriicola soli]|uniref:non-specific protein-tyrosine kinase n=1 Tax=Muriicola soli TaxID=2507538 RepID=A0A411E894_9FLAO|nr:polysaccharide biosynthesis tyrosine autokinase [Muriicola soli]QBA63902.1 polysaccharide biosynthesis tyrosine autokinase [Muriicola soli]